MKIDNVTVFSKANCSHCEQTKAWLKDHDVEFDEVDIYTNDDAMEAIRDAGHRQAPVVVLNDWEVSWSGHNLINLKGHFLNEEE